VLTGFQTGGVTVTLGLAYLTVLAHERSRQSQALYLRSQSQLLNTLVSPEPLREPPSRAEVARRSRENLVESAKDRWNAEIENAMRWAQTTDWSSVREGMEGAVARALGLGLEKSREGIAEAEARAGPVIHEAVEKTKDAASRGAHQAAVGIERGLEKAVDTAKLAAEKAPGYAKTAATEGPKSTRDAAHRIAESTSHAAHKAAESTGHAAHKAAESTSHAATVAAEKAREVAGQLQNSGAGTVDAARGAVRNFVNQGIEKGKEVLEKVQDAAGLAGAAVASTASSPVRTLRESDVERALRERYEQPTGMGRTVEEVLQERYTPIDKRDNTVLRGV
jgi:altered-inheritance-of-mitochondria protein 5